MKLVSLLVFLSLTAHAQPPEAPEWIHDSERHVIGGDIIHWGTGEDRQAELALFKARQMAIGALIEECGGIAHKDITPRQQYVEPMLVGYRAFARVSLEFNSCQQAKRGGKNMENKVIVEKQKTYNTMVLGMPSEAEKQKEIENRAIDLIKDERSSYEQALGELQSDMETMKLEKQLAKDKEPDAKFTAAKVCWDDYKATMNELTVAAAEFDGNMAHPELIAKLNAAEKKKERCQGLN